MPSRTSEDAIIRGILDRVDAVENVTQRALAQELGIALGLANAYVRRCITKGWIKVRQAPAKRYRYYLTPRGFAEKSRLTAQYLSDGLRLFRRARQSYDRLFQSLRAAGVKRVVLCGCDDLTEVAILSTLAAGIDVMGIWSEGATETRIRGIPVITLAQAEGAEGLVLASTREAAEILAELYRRVPAGKVVVPDLLTQVVPPLSTGLASE